MDRPKEWTVEPNSEGGDWETLAVASEKEPADDGLSHVAGRSKCTLGWVLPLLYLPCLGRM